METGLMHRFVTIFVWRTYLTLEFTLNGQPLRYAERRLEHGHGAALQVTG
jgi:hypothetical protein